MPRTNYSQHQAKHLVSLRLISARHVTCCRIALLVSLPLLLFVATPQARLLSQSAQERADTGKAAQDDRDVRVLEVGKPVERELAGGQVHSYQLRLTSGQFLHAVVDQRGIDVVVTLFGPDGKKLAEVNNPNGTQGLEPVMIVAEASGGYRLEVRSPEKDAATARYEVKIKEIHTATAQDRSRVAAQIAAQQAFMQGEQLIAQGMAESLRRSIEKFKEALQFFHAAGNHSGEAITLVGIGFVYSGLGEYQKALDYFNQSLPLLRAAGERRVEADTLNNIGVLYDNLGEKQKALDYLDQALPILRAVGDRRGEAITLNNIGNIYNYLGEYQKALDYLNQALPLLRTVGDRKIEADMLNNIGGVYNELGEKQKALDYYNQALPLRRAAGDRRGEAVTLNNIGSIYHDLGEYQKALDHFNQALPLLRAAGERRVEAHTLSNIGGVYNKLGEKQKALDYFNQSLPLLRAVGDRRGEAHTLSNIGKVYNDLGEYQKALDYLNQALPLQRAVGDRSWEATTLSNIARNQRARGDLVAARSQIEAALDLIESLRTKVASQDLRTAYFASVRDFYELYIDLLMQLHKQRPSAGYDGAALQASERARARSLLELLTEARADIRQGIDPVLLERQRSLQQQLNAKAERQWQMLSGKHTEEQAAAIKREIEALTTELQQVEAQIRVKSPRYAALTQPQPLSLREIQQLLDVDTLLLEYALGDEKSYLWAVTPTSITSHELPKRAEIEAVARRLYNLLTAGAQNAIQERTKQRELSKDLRQASSAQYREEAARLSQMLLLPVAPQLGAKRLVIVSDGALQFVPFGALPTPSTKNSASREAPRPLVIDHEMVSLPSASTIAMLRQEVIGRTPAPKAIAVLADPVFSRDDERVQRLTVKTASMKVTQPIDADETRGVGRAIEDAKRSAAESGVANAELHIPRLPGTRREAETILAFVPAAESKPALDFAASRATATSAELSQYRYVHFATHGFLNSTHPELSGVVLSMVDGSGAPQDGFLRAHELFNLRLPAELVVLSACQTGLGKEVRGEGLVGLTRGFMYAGARRVVVSLWNVSDEATAELMARFYGGMLKEGQRPAAALRAAQVEMWKKKQWEQPYYWAAFTLQGEWK